MNNTPADHQDIQSWFADHLKAQGKTNRQLAKFLNMDPSATSRTLSGKRKMKMHEAQAIATFLGLELETILTKINSLDPNQKITDEIILTYQIDGNGHLSHLQTPLILSPKTIKPLTSILMTQEVITVAANIIAPPGSPLALMDNTILFFSLCSEINPKHVGLSIIEDKDKQQQLCRVHSIRHTGEIFITTPDGNNTSLIAKSITPVIAITP